MKRKDRICSLDGFKWVAVFLVVVNHTAPLEHIWDDGNFFLADIAARVAVPFFFMVTGFFTIYPALRRGDGKRILRAAAKTGLLYLGASALYLPVQIYRYRELFSKAEEKSIGKIIGAVCRMLVFDGTYYHLWYLPAAILGLFVICGLLKAGRRAAWIGCGVLYGFGLLGDSYHKIVCVIPFLNRVYGFLFGLFSYTRNGLFMAPVFMLLGYLAAQRRETPCEEKVSGTRRGVLVLGCFAGMTAEGFLVRYFQLSKWDSMYLFLPPLAWNLMLFLLAGNEKYGRQKTSAVFESSFFTRGPMLVYILHPMVLLLVRGASKAGGMPAVAQFAPLRFLLVFVGSCLLAWGITAAVERMRRGGRSA